MDDVPGHTTPQRDRHGNYVAPADPAVIEHLLQTSEARIPAAARAELDRQIDVVRRGRSTRDRYWQQDAAGYWIPTPAWRDRVARIVAAYLDGGRGVPRPGEQPTLVMLAGAPAAGKSSAFNHLFNGSPATDTRFLYMNNDDIKALLPEYHRGKHIKLATLVHDESGLIQDAIQEAAFAQRRHIVIDGTMKTPAVAQALIARARALGYRVEGYHTQVPLAVNLERAVRRGLPSDGEPGRLVPPSFIAANYDQFQRSFDQVNQPGVFDKWAKYDSDVPLGSQPRVIAESPGGSEPIMIPLASEGASS